MKTIIAAIASLIILTACAPKDATSKFSEGQVWSFSAAADEPDAKFTVVKLEAPTGKDRVIFVLLSEVQLGGLPAYQFMPFSEAALQRSAKTLVSEGPELSGADAGAFTEFYENWHTGVASGANDLCFKETVGAVWAQKRAGTQTK